MIDGLGKGRTEMTSLRNSNKNREQDTKVVELQSPYSYDVESFNNPEMFPDLEFSIRDRESLLLHRKTLANASIQIREMLQQKTQRLEWPFDTSNEVDKEALVKALRFCYGEKLTVGTKEGECFAIIAALTRLQVTCLAAVLEQLGNYIETEAKNNLKKGTELLKTCARYAECCGMNNCSLNQRLAHMILTKENMLEHFQDVVDKCLMLLPQEYFSFVEYGEPHSKCSEFSLKIRYIQEHSMDMTTEGKQALLAGCDWSSLNSSELQTLKYADVIDKDELLEAYRKALDYLELENANLIMRANQVQTMEDLVNQVERERVQERERANIAEARVEESKRCTERKTEEKGVSVIQDGTEMQKLLETLHQSEIEKEEQHAEIEQLKQEKHEIEEQLKKAETERDECKSRLAIIETFETPEGNRLLIYMIS